MAMQARELKEWLSHVDDAELVAINDDGMAIVVVGADDDAYLEIGCVPSPLELCPDEGLYRAEARYIREAREQVA